MFLKNVTTYVGSNLISQAARVVQEFVIRGLIPPYLMGIWSLTLVVQDLANSFDIGVTSAAFRELPILAGAGDQSAELETRSTAFWSRFVQGLILAGGIVGYTVIFQSKYDRLQILGLMVAALLVVLGSISDSLICFLQGRQEYVPLSKVQLAFSLWHAISLPIGAIIGGITGVLIAAAISFGVQAVLLWIVAARQNIRISRIWEWPIFRGLLSYGLPMRFVDYPIQIFPMLDVLVVSRYLGVGPLAIYATGRAVLIQGQEIVTRMSNVFMMRMFNQSGAQVKRTHMAADLMRLLMVNYLVTVPVIIVGGNVGVSLLLTRFLPNYAGSVGIVKILLFVMFFTPQTTLLRSFWVLDKNFRAIAISNVIGFSSISLSLFIFTRQLGLQLNAIALGMAVGYSLYFLYIMLSIGRQVWGLPKTLQLIGYLSLSVGYTALVVFLLTGQTLGNDFLAAVQTVTLTALLSLLLLAPLVCIGLWKSGSLAYLKRGRVAN